MDNNSSLTVDEHSSSRKAYHHAMVTMCSEVGVGVGLITLATMWKIEHPYPILISLGSYILVSNFTGILMLWNAPVNKK